MKKSDLYLPGSGFFNFRAVRDLAYPFTLIIGGRGTGKTFGALESSIEDRRLFCYLRRKKTELDIINKDEFSPLRPICRARGWEYTSRPIAPGIVGFFSCDTDEDGKTTITGPAVGMTAALSTFGSLRGFDSSDVELLLYDEAIPERGERPLPHEPDKLDNAYETINRNRELQGRPPLQLIVMGNANDQASPILTSWGLASVVDKLRSRGGWIHTDDRRGICLVLLEDSPVTEQKRDTALYRRAAGTDFAGMALDNAFAYNDRSHIIPRPLGEYTPRAVLGACCIYRHKAEQRYYVTEHRQGSPKVYPDTETGRGRFCDDFGYLYRAYFDGRVDFEDFGCLAWFEALILKS